MAVLKGNQHITIDTKIVISIIIIINMIFINVNIIINVIISNAMIINKIIIRIINNMVIMRIVASRPPGGWANRVRAAQ